MMFLREDDAPSLADRTPPDCDTTPDSDLARLTDPAVDRLSARQRECLLLVLEHLQTKEIAQRLSISPRTVEHHIASAKATLGSPTRLQAARRVATHQSRQSLPRRALPIIDEPAEALADVSFEAELRGATPDQPRVVPATRSSPEVNHYAVEDVAGEKSSRLTAVRKLGLIALIAFGMALCFSSVLTGIEALSRLLD